MKLSTLLLSSAALVVAGSAYAADLPAKKGAPAAKATGCPAFGAGFFQIPGSDSCIKLGGGIRFKASYSSDSTTNFTAPYSTGTGRASLTVDVRNNTELGVVRSFADFRATSSAGSSDKAYIQFAGVTVGQQSNLANIAGTNADTFDPLMNLGGTQGIRYDMPVGASTVSVQVVNAVADATSGIADRPDVLLGVKTSAGPVTINVVGASAESVYADTATSTAYSAQGYALVGKASVSMSGGFGASVFGGTSSAAGMYTTGHSLANIDSSGNKSTGSNIGAEVTAAIGNGTLAIATSTAEEKLASAKSKVNSTGISYAMTLAKGLSMEPEFITTETETASDKTRSNTVYLRISRDF